MKTTINLDILESALDIYVGEKGKKEFETLVQCEVSENASGLFAMSEELERGAIWVENYDPATFAHEAVHYIIVLLDIKGIPIDRRNSKVFAYLMSYLMREFRSFADSAQKPKKKTKK